jgi:FkbM family methyltransferase
MNSLRIMLHFFGKTRLRHYPGLVFYFFGHALWHATGLRLFEQRLIQFKGLSLMADVGGMSGLYFLHEILVEEVYQLPAIENGAEVRVLFDVGANCGFYALTQCVSRPHLQARCFEPQPATFRHLQQNIAANHAADRVKAVNAAVGSVSGQCELKISPQSSMGVVASSSVQLVDSKNRPMITHRITVPMITLDEYAERENLWPDIIKVDVEGHEPEVFKGARRCLAHARFAIAECHTIDSTEQNKSLMTAAGFGVEQRGPILFGVK